MRLEYFQMIDRFTVVDVRERMTRAVCKVPMESPVFVGHFPGYPLMPGVLLLECMAQTTGWLVSALTGFTGLPVLAGVKEGKIRNAVFPGDTLEIEGRVVHEGSGYAIGEVAALLSFSTRWIRLLIHRDNEGGPEALGYRRAGNGASPKILTPASSSPSIIRFNSRGLAIPRQRTRRSARRSKKA